MLRIWVVTSSAILVSHGFSPFGAIEIANFCLFVVLRKIFRRLEG